MALYRTVSDRGLWKKNLRNQNPQPQHFHKPQYIDKEAPQVTYSRLSLGEGYRYNSRQSIADINKDIEEANKRFDQAYTSNPSRNFKSCPTTPRATTPTRTLARSRNTLCQGSDLDQCDYLSTSAVISRSAYSRGSYNPSPYNTGSIYGQTFNDDDRYSFESRSLTAYSNYSERDSVIDSNYRYPYAREPVYNLNERTNLDNQCDPTNVVNLFLQKSIFPSPANDNLLSEPVDRNSNSVVKRSCNSESTFSPESESSVTPVSSPVYSTRAAIAQLKKEFLEREPVKPVLRKPKANKYLQNRKSTPNISSTSDYSSQSSPSVQSDLEPKPLTETQTEVIKETTNNNNVSVNKTKNTEVITEANHNSSASEEVRTLLTFPPVLSEVLTSEQERSIVTCDTVIAPPAPAQATNSCDTVHPPHSLSVEQQTGCVPCATGALVTANTGTDMEPFFLSDTVHTEDRPKLHHAEFCSVRKDTTSTCSVSSSEDDDNGGSGHIMVSINPVNTSTVAQQPTLSQVRIEAPPTRQNIWGPSPRHSQQHDYIDMEQRVTGDIVTQDGQQIFSHSASTFYHPQANTRQFEEQHLGAMQPQQQEVMTRNPSFRATRSVSFENALDTETEVDSSGVDRDLVKESEDEPILPERSFQDQAFSNYVESQREKTPQDKPKKKGFLSGLFKKTSKKQQPYGDDYIHIERKLETGETSESEVDTKMQELMDQSPRFHILKNDSSPGAKELSSSTPVVPMPGSPAAKQLFPTPNNVHVSPNGHHEIDQQQHGHDQLHYNQQHPLQQQQQQQDRIMDLHYGLHDQHNIQLDQSLPQVKPTSLDDILNDMSLPQSSPAPVVTPQVKPTSLDDVLHDMSLHQTPPEPVNDNCIVTPDGRIIPEHERTQEIDIDALLCLSDTPEETEEDLENEENEEANHFSFTSSTHQTIVQRSLADNPRQGQVGEQQHHSTPDFAQGQGLDEERIQKEQLMLEQEQKLLANDNFVLEKQLLDKESERLAVLNDSHHSVDEPADTNRDVTEHVTVHREQDNQDLNNSFRERRKPKSMFNFDSFRKPKNKTQKVQKNAKQITQNVNREIVDQPNSPTATAQENQEDLATQIVREIQKSTTELNIKPKQEAKPSFFSRGSMQKSVRGKSKSSSDLKEKRKSDLNSSVEESKVEETIEKDNACNVPEENPVTLNKELPKEPEKKPSFFSMRSSSKDRKNQRRPLSEGDGLLENKEKPDQKAQNGFGGMFSSQKQRPKSQVERLPEEVPPVKQMIIPKTEKPSEEKKKQGGFGGLFGSSKQKRSKSQERTPLKVDHQQQQPSSSLRLSRPRERPPMPPPGGKSGLTDFFAASATSPPVVSTVDDGSDNVDSSKVPPLELSTTLTPSPDARDPTDTLNSRKSAFLQSTLEPTIAIQEQTSAPAPISQLAHELHANQQFQNQRLAQVSPEIDHPLNNQHGMRPFSQHNQDFSQANPEVLSPPQQPQPELRPISQQNQAPSLNSSFADDQGKLKQTGRRSGRFRKSTSTLPDQQQRLSVAQRPPSSLSQLPPTDHDHSPQAAMMDTLIIDSLSRPTTPHQKLSQAPSYDTPVITQPPMRKTSSVGRTESYRKARGVGGEEDRPRMVMRNNPNSVNSLPRQQGRQMRRVNSEESIRNAMHNEDPLPLPRSKSRQEKGKKECSIQ